MKSLRQIIEANMTEAELEEFRAIATQKRAARAKFEAELDELNQKQTAIINKHKNALGMAF